MCLSVRVCMCVCVCVTLCVLGCVRSMCHRACVILSNQQTLMIVVIINEKNRGLSSSGIQFYFWGALVVYASIKLRTLILLSKDQVSALCGANELTIELNMDE